MANCYSILFLTAILILSAPSASSQSIFDYPKERNPYSVGILGGGTYIWNKTLLPVQSGDNLCGSYSHGNAIGYYFGLGGTYMIIEDLLFASGRLFYDSRPVDLQTRCGAPFEVYNPETNAYEILERDFDYAGTLNYIAADVGFEVLPLKQIPLYFRIGFDAGLPIAGTDYTEEFEIVAPLGPPLIPGLNSSKQRTGEGEITGAGLSMGVNLGIGYEYPVPQDFIDNLFVQPEISYRYGINSILSSEDWNQDIFRAGIAVKWKFGGYKPPKPEPEPVKEPPKEPEPPIVIKDEKHEIRTFEAMPLIMNETVVTQAYPLLPYIFYDSASAELNSKYIHESLGPGNFSEEGLPKSTLNIYYRILDIVGSRMKKYPKAEITLYGVTDGIEEIGYDKRLVLAKERAENAAKYISKKWGIEEGRIFVKFQEKPKLPTSQAYDEGYEENRRLEIYSDYPEILAPVIHSKFHEFKSKLNRFYFSAAMEEKAKPKSWKLYVYHHDEKLKEISGNGAPPSEITIGFDYDFLLKLGADVKSGEKLHSILQVEMEGGSGATKESPLEIIKTPNNFEVGRLNLIVFDFDRHDISEVNKAMISEFIESAISPASMIWIKGFTDRLGAYDYNMQLSRSRAENIGEYIESLQPGVNIREIKGLGPQDLKYDNDLPEGRFYCRTVLVEVRTPLTD